MALLLGDALEQRLALFTERNPVPEVAVFQLTPRNGRAQVLTSRLGYRTIPSVVAFDPQGRLLVGHAAKAQMVVNPRHTVYGSKRLVGRPFRSPTVQACRDRFHYEIVEGADGAAAAAAGD